MTARFSATVVQSAICKTTAKSRPAPSLFYFPGLTARPFHNPQNFPWVAILEENVDVIKREYLDMRRKQIESDYKEDNEHPLHQGTWNWHSYVLKGKIQDSFHHHCPETTRILEEFDKRSYLMSGTPFSFCFFSTLHGNSQIAAHTAPCNLRIRCHLPLIVPKALTSSSGRSSQGRDYESLEDVKANVPCGMRIGDHIRHWEEGKCIVFDDSYEHEVWNLTDSERVLLLVDFWHPELEGGEKIAIRNMFEPIMQKKAAQGAAAV